VFSNDTKPQAGGLGRATGRLSRDGWSDHREVAMKVIVDLCVVPIGVGVSLSTYVAECERVLGQNGVTYSLHANGTNIEGDWDDVFAAIKQCHEAVHQMGAPRIFTTLKIGTRTDKTQHMEDKVRSVEDKLWSAK
jgi:uncharacterized protein (TIGR00106 family)